VSHRKRSRLPPHVSGTVKGWRERKRREFLSLVRAAKRFNRDSAWTPVETNDLFEWLRAAQDKLWDDWNPLAYPKPKTLSQESRRRVQRTLSRLRS
jgi:hypothetical protein